MDENPYSAPIPASKADGPVVDRPVVGLRSGKAGDLLRVLRLQRYAAVMLSLWIPAGILNVLGILIDRNQKIVSEFVISVPEYLEITFGVLVIAGFLFYAIVWFATVLLNSFLTARFYHPLVALLAGLISAYPGAGFVVTLLLNFKARRVMRANGIPLGPLWAKRTAS
ncbi:MAG: hypothetical protein KF708_21085 [Pirellulales bacterium]|nr:hypothetical protein [Pirellulales bacterium]